MSSSALHLARLTLTNFRSYPSFSLECTAQPIVITGANGAGKTNLLEAVSLLVPGRGLRRAKLSEMECDRPQPPSSCPSAWPSSPWVVHATLTTGEEGVEIGTGRDAEAAAQGIERRAVRIDGQPATQNALAEHASVVWLTPQMDGVFLEGQSARRKFLDRLVYGFESTHAAQVSTYEQAMRERNQLLQDRRSDPVWFEALEHKKAEAAIAIAACRLQTLERLNTVIQQLEGDFPKAKLTLNGVVENDLQEGKSALEVEERFRTLLAQCRREDMQSGRTAQGTHRTEFQAIHLGKNREVGECSTGEQKAVLLSIILAETKALALWGKHSPLLLLDEVVAHLDTKRRAQLAEAIFMLNVQAWLTGTDAETFHDFAAHAQRLAL